MEPKKIKIPTSLYEGRETVYLFNFYGVQDQRKKLDKFYGSDIVTKILDRILFSKTYSCLKELDQFTGDYPLKRISIPGQDVYEYLNLQFYVESYSSDVHTSQASSECLQILKEYFEAPFATGFISFHQEDILFIENMNLIAE